MPKEPTLDVQRRILAEKEARYRAEAWEHDVNAELAHSEIADDGATDPRLKQAADESQRESQRLYRLADRCAAMLAKLPAPKPKTE